MKATSSLHRGFSGATSDFVFRQYNGKTVVSLRPVYKNETNTEARRQSRRRFRDATEFANNAMFDKKEKAYYMQKARQLKVPNAYTAAITDYLRKAKVKAIVRSSFAAKKGDVIHIKVSKSVFRINKIRALLHDKDGKLLTEQTIVRTETQKTFHINFADDYPDYSSLKIISDEPLSQSYTINASEFLVVRLA